MKASPAVLQLAAEHGIDLTTIPGSGPGGRIVRKDIEPLIAGPGESSGQLNSIQRLIARRMTHARQTVPDFSLSAEIAMDTAWQARERARGEVVMPSFNDMVIRACALALRAHPHVNASYRDERWEQHPAVHIGVAVAGDRTLVVPVVRDADAKPLREIARETKALAERVRVGTISPQELVEATFTVSNLGMLGVDAFEAVIDVPQAAIIAVGAIKQRPVVRGGELAVGRTMWVTLACDHRIVYGAEAARFLGDVRRLLEEPSAL
jgi:pyruvate dehydrogenase E2 component (dihydrolipoamide acetyltransferase)